MVMGKNLDAERSVPAVHRMNKLGEERTLP